MRLIDDAAMLIDRFHIIASCLSKIHGKSLLIDEDIALFCIEITDAFGLDTKRGDSICSALQGLFFDFRIWSSCSITIKTLIVDTVSNYTKNGGDLLYKYVGVQRVLDFLRLHIMIDDSSSAASTEQQIDYESNHKGTEMPSLSSLYPPTTPSSSAAAGVIASTGKPSSLKLDCVDAGYRLLLIAVESARIYHQKNKSHQTFQSISDTILRCLDESSYDLLSERMLRIMYQMHSYAPQAVQRSLTQSRFSDTSAVAILSKQQYTLETRKLSLELMFWYMTEEYRHVLPTLVNYRKQIQMSKADDAVITTRSRSDSNAVKQDSKKTLDLSILYSEAALPLKRAWENLSMLSSKVEEAIAAGFWGSTSLSTAHAASELTEHIDYILDFLSFESASGDGIAPWLVLPILPALLSHSSLLTIQRILMSLNVGLKTDEMQVEAISSFPDRLWMKYVIALAIISEKLSPMISSDGFEVVFTEQCQRDDNRVAATCTELALDTLSTIIERKMRFSGSDAKITWRNLHSALTAESLNLRLETQTKRAVDKRYLRRCLALVFQRIAKSTEAWSSGLLDAMITMFSMVYNQRLCGNVILINHDTLVHKSPVKPRPEEALISFDDDISPSITGSDMPPTTPTKITNAPHTLLSATQSEEETQILCFCMDILVNLRKTYSAQGIPKRESKVLKLGLAIILGCMRVVNPATADRICRDITAQIRFMCDPNILVVSELFNDFIVTTFGQLHLAISDSSLPEITRDRYCALVHTILHYFHDSNTPTAAPSSTKNSAHASPPVAGYVTRMRDALKHVDPNFDIITILSEIELALPLAGSTFTALMDQDIVADANIVSDIDTSSSAATGKFKVVNDMLTDDGNLAFSSGDGALLDLMISTKSPSTADSNASDSASLVVISSTGESRDNNLVQWWQVRQGILIDRIDTERARLNNDMRSYFINMTATDKFWRRLRRSLESEIFFDKHHCHWKLGISHEAQFPARKRVVLRPSYDTISKSKESANDSNDSEHHSSSSSSHGNANSSTASSCAPSKKHILQRDKPMMDSDEISRSLAKYSGHIRDVTSSSQEETNDEEEQAPDLAEDGANAASGGGAAATGNGIADAGSGWGLVDADGSDEGYGIVGVINNTADDGEMDRSLGKAASSHGIMMSETEPPSSSGNPTTPLPVVHDMMGDVRLVEAAMNEGRRLETGPCLSGTRRVLHGPPKQQAQVILITASGNIWGTLAFNDKEIFFVSSLEPEDGHKEDNAAVNVSMGLRMRRRRWPMSSIGGVYLRRYRLRDTAMEVFFRRGKHRSFFIDFGHQKESPKNRNVFAKRLMAASPRSAFKQWPSTPIHRLVSEHSGLQEKWINHEIGNFEYLMMLNTIAGRSYHDLCQYPIMPWVISQYTEPTIDLSDPKNYRDLSKPMGAINPTRLAEFLSRFESLHENFAETEIPAFMYGSHYSTMVGVVLHYLVRLEPFASLHKEMQAGHFDVCDRLFSSIPRTWTHNTTQLSEVKELTPEWFTQPNMFRNKNAYDLGTTQDGKTIDEVELPPWAATPEEFVKIMSIAMESEYVSQHLHEWIDLIFGYKQQGPEARAANNVFYYLTYYGTVDRDLIEDESLRQAIELQIAHFGQMPYQLFKTSHPARNPMKQSKSIIPRLLAKCFVRPDVHPKSVDELIPVSSTLTTNIPPSKQWVSPSNYEEKLVIYSHPVVMHRTTLSQNRHVMLATSIGNDRISIVLSNGIVEVYKYGTSDVAKQRIVNQAARAKARSSSTNASSSTSTTTTTTTSQARKNSNPPLPSPAALKSPSTSNSSRDRIAEDSNTSLPVAADEMTSSTVISFDDDMSMMMAMTFDHSSNNVAPAADGSAHGIAASSPSVRSTPPIASNSTSSSSTVTPEVEDALIYLSKDTTHFDIIPRIVLAKNPTHLRTAAALTGLAASHIHSPIGHLLKFTVGNQLLLSTGFLDGRIGVWELDKLTGFVQASADYLQHRARVVCLATDAIPNSSTDVIASVDTSGVILVWAVAKILTGVGQDDSGNSVVFRHPQRLFRCWKSNAMCVDISCNISVVACISADVISLFSIERNELLNSFNLSIPEPLVEDIQMQPKHIAMSDDGFLAIHINIRSADMILCYTLSGELCQEISCASEITFFDCPRHGEVLVTGYMDGLVILYSMRDLHILFSIDVHRAAIPSIDPVQILSQHLGMSDAASSKQGSAPSSNTNSSHDLVSKKVSLPPSAIATVSLGPDPLKPAIMVVTTIAGDMFVKPMLDFFKWERNRSPSVLSQIVTGNIQAFKGTLQQAQNFISSTSESASAIAQNARQYADEAFGELKKINRASIWKGVGTFFGVKEQKDSSNPNSNQHHP
jgi:hypothetical protein